MKADVCAVEAEPRKTTTTTTTTTSVLASPVIAKFESNREFRESVAELAKCPVMITISFKDQTCVSL